MDILVPRRCQWLCYHLKWRGCRDVFSSTIFWRDVIGQVILSHVILVFMIIWCVKSIVDGRDHRCHCRSGLCTHADVHTFLEACAWATDVADVRRTRMYVQLLQAFCLFWGLGTQIHHLSFSNSKKAFSTLQKHYVLKENDQFWREKYNQNGKEPEGQMVPFSRMYTPPF